MSSIRKELLLHDLNCAECAEKIQQRLNGLAPDAKATIHFATGKLIIETQEDNKLNQIIKEAVHIIESVEPGVRITEKTIRHNPQKTLMLIGLDCAHCAERIEKEVGNLPGIQKATINFATKQLIIDITHPDQSDALLKNIQQLIDQIEGNIQLVEHNRTASNLDTISPKEYFRLIIALVFFAIAIIMPSSSSFKALLLIIAYIISGWDVLFKALKNIFRGQVFDENFLMTLATIGALAIGETAEAVAVMIFYQIGEFFQSLSVRKSRRSIQSLLNIAAEEAIIVTPAGTQTVSPEAVAVGQIIRIRPGDRIPLDGVIIQGNSVLDTAALTGESLPRTVSPGEEILSGSVNLSGVLDVKVLRPYSESTVSRILNLVENAATRKAPTEQFITRFARYYTPGVVIAASLVAVIPPMFLGWAHFSLWLYRALVFLVISCPCALVISIPLGFFGGIGAASRNGILIKGSNYLEALNAVDTVVFDKTGTLTEGRFTVDQILPAEGYTKDTLLEWAALAETWSTHPIAKSIRQAWKKDVDTQRLSLVEELSGKGIKAQADNQTLLVGNKTLFDEFQIPVNISVDHATAVHVALDNQYVGTITVNDRIKKDALFAIDALLKNGIQKIAMVTGDIKTPAEYVAQKIHISEVYSGLLPHEKNTVVTSLQQKMPKGKKLIFVGDGINDAPVLAQSDIGIAMGAMGSDAAIEAADIVLMTDEPSKVFQAITIARYTRKIVFQNIVLALGVKGLVLLLGAVGLATLWEAVFADVGVAILAILNAMRIMKKDYSI